jgi:hypothetical protein
LSRKVGISTKEKKKQIVFFLPIIPTKETIKTCYIIGVCVTGTFYIYPSIANTFIIKISPYVTGDI